MRKPGLRPAHPVGLTRVLELHPDALMATLHQGDRDAVGDPLLAEARAEVDRLVSLGAKHIDIGQGDVPWIVMADPDGNEFCVLTPR